ncbi:MAG: DNA cytosine methyltransferase [bacterium]
MKTKSKKNFVDIFAGAGGLSEGFLRANARHVASIESNNDACQTLTTRLIYHQLKQDNKLEMYQKYLQKKITREELHSHLDEKRMGKVFCEAISENSVDSQIERILDINHKVDLLIGGPPCQAYSHIGRARDPKKMKDDKRNWLYRNYIRFLEKLEPEAFVFENVPGFKSAGNSEFYNELKIQTEKLGYTFNALKLVAIDYGVLQNRKRIIIIGTKSTRPFELDKITRNGYKVGDVLCDLPEINQGEKHEGYKYKQKPTEYLKENEIRTSDSLLTLHVARPHNSRDLEIYKIAVELWNNEKRRLSYNDLPDSLKTHKNTKSFTDRFKVVAADEPYSQTVMAHIAKDGHYYIHPDIKQNRSLTMREAARLQSFPDNYFFEGPRTSVFKQIGNAVPPLMAYRIAEGILRRI